MKQTQTLAPQMRESLRILQLSAFELQQEIKKLVETNPVIESVKNPFEKNMSDRSIAPDEKKSGAITENELNFDPNGEAAEKTLSADDEYRDYFLGNMESAPSDEQAQTQRDRLFESQRVQKSLTDYLLEQLEQSSVKKELHPLAAVLIHEIDDSGYFKGSVPDIIMVHGTDKKTIDSLLKEIQMFDPVGCGSRNLKECLLAQMERFDDSPWEDEIRTIVESYLDDMASDRVERICSELNISADDYRKIKQEFKLFTPCPGDVFRAEQERSSPLLKKDGVMQLKSTAGVIAVDVMVVRDKSSRWTVVPESRNIPKFKLSKEYKKMASSEDTPEDVKKYLDEKFAEVDNFTEYAENREETIFKIASEIVKNQTEFFEKGKDSLRPLTMSKVAESCGVDVSTVSRAVRGKYMRTNHGVMEFKDFFVQGYVSDSGENISVKKIQDRIKEIVIAEDATKPLSDESIAAILNKEGVDIKRRTVAKYRTQLGIPGTSGRKRV